MTSIFEDSTLCGDCVWCRMNVVKFHDYEETKENGKVTYRYTIAPECRVGGKYGGCVKFVDDDAMEGTGYGLNEKVYAKYDEQSRRMDKHFDEGWTV